MDGEDEISYNTGGHWFGDVFLLKGEVTSEDIGTELTAADIMTRDGDYCGWENSDQVLIECREGIAAELVAGLSYTVLTKADRVYDHGHDDDEDHGDEDDYQTGSYSHVMYDNTGEHIMNITGNVTDSSPIADFLDAKTTSYGQEFVMYHAETFIVGEDGFNGTLTSYGYQCFEYDGNKDCYSSYEDGMIFIYDAFDTTDTLSLIHI